MKVFPLFYLNQVVIFTKKWFFSRVEITHKTNDLPVKVVIITTSAKKYGSHSEDLHQDDAAVADFIEDFKSSRRECYGMDHAIDKGKIAAAGGQAEHRAGRKVDKMARYKASNGRIIDTKKIDCILTGAYKGQYGRVSQDTYRAGCSGNWYRVAESSWSGGGEISSATAITQKEATELVMEHCPERIDDFPELEPFLADVVDE